MSRVVITGMGVVSPIGNNVSDFWNNQLSGVCGIDFITHYDASPYKVTIAGEVKNFSATDFGIEKSEQRRMDLFSQFAIAAATEAMKDSGLCETNISPEQLGVYVGSGTGGIGTLVSEINTFVSKKAVKTSPFLIPMMIGNIASGHVAMKFNAQGVCLPIVTACATGTHCIGEAYRAIKLGLADAIIAGGAEASINPVAIAGFYSCMALSQRNNPKEASIPFDKRRDGFVMGEGAGILILEEYEHAIKRNAHIYAEIIGYGNTCDAYHITSPKPDGECAARAIKLSMQEVKDKSNIYINAHGTSTPLNDKYETIAIKKALGDNAYKALISSTKSMTGHMLGAAGAVEAVSAVLALKNNIAPPTIGFKEKDDDCDLDYVPNEARKAEINTSLSISLGFGGHNACISFVKV